MAAFRRNRPERDDDARRWTVTEEVTVEADIWPVWNLLYSPDAARLTDATAVPCGRMPGSGPGVGEIQVVLRGSPPSYLESRIVTECQAPTHVVFTNLDAPSVPRVSTEYTLTGRAAGLTHVRCRASVRYDPALAQRELDADLALRRDGVRALLRRLQQHMSAVPR